MSLTNRRVTISDLQQAKSLEKWAMVATHDYTSAKIFDEAGIPVLLVGDSAANVVYGYDTTLPITMDEMLPLVAAVARGSNRAMVVADMPFGSYQVSAQQALENAMRFMKQGGAHAVKVEGGSHCLPAVELMTQSGIPVMGHLGLTPQSVHQLGGYKVQGRGDDAIRLVAEAKALVEAGVFAIVLEVMPDETAQAITSAVPVPTVGIGAGPHTDAHVMLWQDFLGLGAGKVPKFVKQYANLRTIFTEGAIAFANEVKSGAYPSPDHSYLP